MSLKENVSSLQYKVNSKFAFNYDELVNIKLDNRKTDVWFTEEDRMMITMRNWTTRIWDQHDVAWGVSNQFFFTDYHDTRWHFKWYNNKIWRLEWSTWTDTALAFTWNNFLFNAMRLPIMDDWSIPTTYTCPSTATTDECVVPDATDATTNPVKKILVIVNDPSNQQVHRWAYWEILWVNGSWEYELSWAWLNAAITNWAQYQIYDNFWEYLQISNGVNYEKYILIKSDQSIVENTSFQWLATKSLRLIGWIKDTEFIKTQLSFNYSYWTFVRWTVYFTYWYPWNPFYYRIANALTISWINGWVINDLFEFKWRLVVAWNNFVSYLTAKDVYDYDIDTVTKSYWIYYNSLQVLWDDALFVATSWQVYSLVETITWALSAKNIWKVVSNYLEDFLYWHCSWFDGKNVYFYWQPDVNAIWTILVYNVEYQFWCTYTWLRPSTIINEGWSVYLSDNNSSTIRIFTEWSITDIWTEIEQKVALKDLDLWDVFTVKTLTDLYFWLDNYTQILSVDTYMSLSWANADKQTKIITIEWVDTTLDVPAMWEWALWEQILNWDPAISQANFPFLKHIEYNADKANLWKVVLTWVDWSPFYLNQLDIEIWFDWERQKSYFSPKDTI